MFTNKDRKFGDDHPQCDDPIESNIGLPLHREFKLTGIFRSFSIGREAIGASLSAYLTGNCVWSCGKEGLLLVWCKLMNRNNAPTVTHSITARAN